MTQVKQTAPFSFVWVTLTQEDRNAVNIGCETIYKINLTLGKASTDTRNIVVSS